MAKAGNNLDQGGVGGPGVLSLDPSVLDVFFIIIILLKNCLPEETIWRFRQRNWYIELLQIMYVITRPLLDMPYGSKGLCKLQISN